MRVGALRCAAPPPPLPDRRSRHPWLLSQFAMRPLRCRGLVWRRPFMAEFRDAIVIALGVIEIRAGLNCCGPSLKHLCSCLLERDFKIALVEYNECLPCFDYLIIVDIDALNSPGNARADLVHVRRG